MKHKVYIDIIILSYAKDEQLKNLTIQTIDTLLASEDPEEIEFNVVVIESNKGLSPYQFTHSTTIYPEVKFGFNKYLNIGINSTNNPYICLCNNDLLFHKHWASEMLNVMQTENALSAAPFCPVAHVRVGYPFAQSFITSYKIFSGWCFLIKRELINKIGLFDENFNFWYADNDYLKTLESFGIKNYMVTNSNVTHLSSETSKLLPTDAYKKLTIIPIAYYNYKWSNQTYVYFLIKKLYLQLMIKIKKF